ncbi:high nitrogen upregulated cytochrome P450 monooxygenase 2 [Agrocybe pediades]|nr:high nitrogen upregulated cytochrome P450 monooxygenase 2 [Agrocybe pediades]
MSYQENHFVVVILTALATHLWLRSRAPASTSVISLWLFAISSTAAFSSLIGHNVGIAKILQSYFLYFVALTSSVIIYRLSPFHRLARYPGPLLCKISKLWVAYVASRGKLHLYHKELHDKYGPIVRVGPNELSVVDKDFIPTLLGTPGLPKGPLFDGRVITTTKDRDASYTLISTPDLQRHAQLRKPWNKAFGSEPMNDYAEILVEKANVLKEELMKRCQLSADQRGHVDLAGWINFFSFDFMGEMAFGGSFDLMRHGDKDGLWHGMQSALLTAGVTQHVPWLAHIVRAIPSTGVALRRFGQFAVNQAKTRFSKEVEKRDLFYHLIHASEPDSDPTAPNPTYLPLVVSNATLAIIAGSDTTSTVLSNIFYYLIHHPEYMKRLKAEIDEHFPLSDTVHGTSAIELGKLGSMKFLNAIINETLRLQPAVPTSLQRQPAKGSGGQAVGEYFIPEGTAVNIPPYCLHRNPRYFSPRTDDFWPERWLLDKTTAKGFVHDMSAFIPFSVGPANCAGKHLALLELRYVTTLLVRGFDFKFEEGFTAQMWEDGIEDRFVMAKGPLPVVLTPRY